MKYIMFISLFLVGCSTLPVTTMQDGIERQTFTLSPNGVYSVGIETGKRTSKSLLESRLMRDVQRPCPHSVILNREYEENEVVKNMQITYQCIKIEPRQRNF